MEINIYNNKSSLSNENVNNVKEENNLENESIGNQEKVNEIEKPESSNKILTFIKTRPLLFSMIVIGACAIIILAVTLPVVLISKNKADENSSNSNKNEVSTFV